MRVATKARVVCSLFLLSVKGTAVRSFENHTIYSCPSVGDTPKASCTSVVVIRSILGLSVSLLLHATIAAEFKSGNLVNALNEFTLLEFNGSFQTRFGSGRSEERRVG